MGRNMTPQEERYWMHALSGDPIIGSFLRQQGMFTDWVQRAANQPICPRCERMAFHHTGGTVACPSCGYMGVSEKIKLKIHLRDGGYR